MNTGEDIQGYLADGQGIYGYGVLHCYLEDQELAKKAAETDYEEYDELPEGEESRFTEDEYGDDRQKAKKYRETDESYLNRRSEAKVGWPWRARV